MRTYLSLALLSAIRRLNIRRAWPSTPHQVRLMSRLNPAPLRSAEICIWCLRRLYVAFHLLRADLHIPRLQRRPQGVQAHIALRIDARSAREEDLRRTRREPDAPNLHSNSEHGGGDEPELRGVVGGDGGAVQVVDLPVVRVLLAELLVRVCDAGEGAGAVTESCAGGVLGMVRLGYAVPEGEGTPNVGRGVAAGVETSSW